MKSKADAVTAQDWRRIAEHMEYQWSCCSEGFNKRVGELQVELTAANEQIRELERLLDTLKQSQGEPFGWYWDTDYEDGIIVNDGGNYDVQPNWTPLYITPPTVAAERAISDKLEKALEAVDEFAKNPGQLSRDHDGVLAQVRAALAAVAAIRAGDTAHNSPK